MEVFIAIVFIVAGVLIFHARPRDAVGNVFGLFIFLAGAGLLWLSCL